MVQEPKTDKKEPHYLRIMPSDTKCIQLADAALEKRERSTQCVTYEPLRVDRK